MKKMILGLILSTFLFSFYNIGETVSTSDQGLTKSTCYEGNGYGVNDNWSLSDWNGNINGGNYNVVFIEMSATW
ncbi:hypothetical protein OAQ87_01595 [Candidatus Marinimicrobia bacterium]|nr:hypothetical protein [Candidatus Neomarinimicrobiota bacterium]